MGGPSFCAIDFETANSMRGSPCAVGLVKVIEGEVADTRRWLMRPPDGADWFDDFNISLHGITPAMVRGEPRFKKRLPEILDFAGGLPLVAHNAAFDLGVIRDACDESGIPWPAVSYACTLVLARRTYQLLSYSLPWVAEAAGWPMGENHHEPEADALAAARILLDVAARNEAPDLDAVLAATHCIWGVLDPTGWRGSVHRQAGGGYGPPLRDANPDADPEHPFYGREMVFTGALSSMAREDAWSLVADRGGRPAAGVTKHTDILVMGYQDAYKLRPGATLSAKAQKAADLRAKGQAIEIMGEVDFIQSLGEVGRPRPRDPGAAVLPPPPEAEPAEPRARRGSSNTLEITISLNEAGEIVISGFPDEPDLAPVRPRPHEPLPPAVSVRVRYADDPLLADALSVETESYGAVDFAFRADDPGGGFDRCGWSEIDQVQIDGCWDEQADEVADGLIGIYGAMWPWAMPKTAVFRHPVLADKVIDLVEQRRIGRKHPYRRDPAAVFETALTYGSFDHVRAMRGPAGWPPPGDIECAVCGSVFESGTLSQWDAPAVRAAAVLRGLLLPGDQRARLPGQAAVSGGGAPAGRGARGRARPVVRVQHRPHRPPRRPAGPGDGGTHHRAPGRAGQVPVEGHMGRCPPSRGPDRRREVSRPRWCLHGGRRPPRRVAGRAHGRRLPPRPGHRPRAAGALPGHRPARRLAACGRHLRRVRRRARGHGELGQGPGVARHGRGGRRAAGRAGGRRPLRPAPRPSADAGPLIPGLARLTSRPPTSDSGDSAKNRKPWRPPSTS